MWCAISAVGVFRTDDGGENWELKNQGVTVSSPDEQYDIGYCVHGLVADPANADRIWRQDHSGVYRTSDGGDHWERIEQGLPASFGFPIARDRASGTLFVVPLESDEMRLPPGGRLRVYRSDDDGDNWEESGQGWPEGALYAGVLRGALATDQLDPGGVYLGTTSGTLHYSTDTGTTWQTLPWVLPRILSLSVFVE